MLEFNATFIVAMLSFIVFMVIMNSILYKPLARIQKERAELIQAENEAQKITEGKTEKLKEHYSEVIENSKLIAKDNFNKKVSEYKQRKETILETSRSLAKKDLAIANTELEGDEREARLILKPQIIEFASTIASKVLGYETKIGGSD